MAIFLAILLRAWRSCNKLIRPPADLSALQWIHNLARAFQVSLVAYGVAGAALNMAYFEMFYVFVVLVAIQEQMVKRHFQTVAPTNTADPFSLGAGKSSRERSSQRRQFRAACRAARRSTRQRL